MRQGSEDIRRIEQSIKQARLDLRKHNSAIDVEVVLSGMSDTPLTPRAVFALQRLLKEELLQKERDDKELDLVSTEAK